MLVGVEKLLYSPPRRCLSGGVLSTRWNPFTGFGDSGTKKDTLLLRRKDRDDVSRDFLDYTRFTDRPRLAQRENWNPTPFLPTPVVNVVPGSCRTRGENFTGNGLTQERRGPR